MANPKKQANAAAKQKQKQKQKPKSKPKPPPQYVSKIAQARMVEKQLTRELNRLELMQPNAFSSVRFHRFVTSFLPHLRRMHGVCMPRNCDCVHGVNW